MNIDAEWFRRRPEYGGVWSVRIRWTHPAGDQRRTYIHTAHTSLEDAAADLSVTMSMKVIAEGGDPGPGLTVTEWANYHGLVP